MTIRLGSGIYTVPEAARILGMPEARLRRWVVGTSRDRPALPTSLQVLDGEPWLSFVDLVSAMFIEAFRKEGLSLQHIRKVALKAAKELDTERPFSMSDFPTDGHRIYRWIEQTSEVRAPDRRRGKKRRRRLVDALTGQGEIDQVLKPILRNVQYGTDSIAERWFPLGKRRPVVVDPEIGFGEPTVRGVPTRVLFGPMKAGETATTVASWYGLTRAEVLAASAFEKKIRRAA